MSNIVIFGAGGFTGSLIVKKLLSQKIQFFPAVRNPQKFKTLFPDFKGKIFTADLNNIQEIEKIIEFADIFVNCVGPFNIFGTKVLEIAVNKGNLLYLDISGEQEFIRNSFEKFSELAIKNNACITHSVAYESFLADLLANAFLSDKKKYLQIASFYHSKNGVLSGGSRFTMRLQPFFKTFAYQNKKFVESLPYSRSIVVEQDYLPEKQKAYFVPYPEIIFFAKTFDVENALTFQIFDDIPGTVSANLAKDSIDEIIDRETKRKRIYIKDKFLQREKFYFLLEAVEKSGKKTSITAQGVDTYNFTALLVSEFIKALENKREIPAGITNPAALVQPRQFLEKLDLQIKIS